MWRHWDDFRVGKRQHVFRLDVASGNATDLTPVDFDIPTIATGGDGDVAVSPDGKAIAVAMHGDSTVADNTNVDIYLLGPTVPSCGDTGNRGLTIRRGFPPTEPCSRISRWRGRDLKRIV